MGKQANNESMCRHDKIYSWIKFRDHMSVEDLLLDREKEILNKRVNQLKHKDRKSITLTNEDIDLLMLFVNSFNKKIEVIKACGLDYQVVYALIKRGTCSENTLTILKEAIPELATV